MIKDSIYKSVTDSLDTPIVVILRNGSIALSNSAWSDLTTQSNVECAGNNYFDCICAFQPNDNDFLIQYRQHIDALFDSESKKFTIKFPVATVNKSIWLTVCVSSADLDGEKSVILSHTNIFQRNKNVVELDQLTLIDSVTKLANHKKFKMVYKNQWLRSKRDKKPLTLLLGEIDAAYLQGEQQRLVADVFAQHARRAFDLSAILKHNQFALLLPELGFGDCESIAEKINQQIESIRPSSLAKPVMKVSIGISSASPTLIDTSEMLFNAALLALATSKKSDTHNITTYCPTIVYRDVALVKRTGVNSV